MQAEDKAWPPPISLHLSSPGETISQRWAKSSNRLAKE
jgi:hypothetical protein